jgi:hypothetical protein
MWALHAVQFAVLLAMLVYLTVLTRERNYPQREAGFFATMLLLLALALLSAGLHVAYGRPPPPALWGLLAAVAVFLAIGAWSAYELWGSYRALSKA